MKKSLFPQDTPRANRVAVIGGGLAAGGFLLAVLLAPVLSGSPGSDARRPRREARKMAEVPSEPAAAIVDVVPEAQTPASNEELTLPQAMDRTNIRMLVQQLVLAAAQENQPFEKAMLTSLKSYGAQAVPVLEERLAEGHTPGVSRALNEALAQAR